MNLVSTLAVVLALAAMASPVATSTGPSSFEGPSTVSVAAAFVGEPVAVIWNLLATVSNGTPTALDGSDSTDVGGSITNYTWKVSAGGLSQYLYGISVTYTFTVLTTYRVDLTVTDNESMTGTTFMDVEAVIDSDADTLPDWWEQKYFGNLAQGPEDDYDSDGYDNLEEYEKGTNAAFEDPPPGVLSQIPIWAYAAAAAGVAAVLLVAFWPKIKQRRKQREQKKIEYALEIEKALEEDK